MNKNELEEKLGEIQILQKKIKELNSNINNYEIKEEFGESYIKNVKERDFSLSSLLSIQNQILINQNKRNYGEEK